MTVLLRAESPPPARDILVFGSGGIGGAISRRLRQRRRYSPLAFAVPWDAAQRRRQIFDAIGRTIERHRQSRPVSIVWAAGRAGFSATAAEAEREHAAFRDVLALAARLQERPTTGNQAFHLVSSAGGLYEGRSVQSTDDIPAPSRPYGHLKLAEETDAWSLLPPGSVTIHRPSSVYTVMGARTGLLGALVRNGMAQRQTTIVGGLDTLRDYVFADDVGRYVADRTLEDAEGRRGPHMLVSGKPASILQAIRVVEAVTGKRAYVRVAESWNAANITFAPGVKAPAFQTAPLRVGVEMMYSAALGRQVAEF